MVDPLTIARIKTLRDEIRRHEYLYFVKACPEITDQEFDALMHELIELERRFPELVTPDSPTQRVGEAVTSFNTVKHRVPMLSIDNSYSIADIAEWLERLERLAGQSVFPIVAELKIDGVSGSFRYEKGLFIAAATRGNGIEGDLITENAKTIRSLPLKIPSELSLDIRGEIYTPRSVLERLNQQRIANGLEPFKNCRNLTAGTIKSLDPAVVASRGLQVMVYGIAQADELNFKTHSETLKFLEKNSFKINFAYRVCYSLDEIHAFIDDIEQKRRGFDFDIDGIVLKVDSLRLQQELGATSKAPRWALAYKYPQERAISRIKDVIWQVGRSQLTPVAVLESVELGGTTVSRASLHNIDQIREKDIRIGDAVVVEKAGYIIPYIVAALPERRTGQEIEITPPKFCPACQSPISISNADDREETTQVNCNNPYCSGIISRRILHFVTQLEIENLGPQLVEQLLEKKIITQVEDIINLKFSTLLTLERMGEKLAKKIIANIKKAAGARLGQLISALGINNVGIVMADKIATFYNQSFEQFLKANHESLMNVDGISHKVADNIINFIQSPFNQNLIDQLRQWWHGPDISHLPTQQKLLNGKVFVITGEAQISRKQLEKAIKHHGGQVKSSVSKNTNFLLIGSKETEDFSSSKKNKAIELNIPIIDEWKFFEMVGTDIETVKNLR